MAIVSGTIARIQSLVDKLISPDTRKEYHYKLVAFAQDQPILFVCFSTSPQSCVPVGTTLVGH